jgi:hypothetical protein
MLDYAFENDNQLTTEHIELLNRISTLMKSLDADNLAQLKEIYHNNPQIQITKTFTRNKAHAKNKAANNASNPEKNSHHAKDVSK